MRLPRLFPTASIGGYLLALAAVIALPMIVFVVFLMLRLEAQQRSALNSDTQEDARLIARGVERELRDMSTTLKLIATSPELRTGDLRDFHERTKDSLRDQGLYLILIRDNGEMILNTRVPFGQPLGTTGNLASFASVVASNHLEVSDVFIGNVSKKWVFNVAMPLPPELRQSAGAVMVLTQNADELSKVVNKEGLARGWSVAVLDQSNKVVSSTAANSGDPSPLPQDMLALMTDASGTIEDVSGTSRQMYGYARLQDWSWRVVIWGPIANAQTTLISTWRYLVGGSLVLFAGSLLLAYLVARQLRIPIRQIAGMAERIGKGEIVSPIETRIREANQIAIALSNASFDRSEAEDRVHLIMHELVHRTKNIMTLIQAMMRQIARNTASVEEFQSAVGHRLQGLGKSIELLAQEQWAGVSMPRVVAQHLDTFGETKSRVRVSGEEFILRAEAVQNLGLVLHELATNSVKYGALSVPEGSVSLSWAPVVGPTETPLLQLRWEETGGPATHAPSTTGFGTTIIKRHAAASFNGQVDVDYLPQGFRWTLTGPRSTFERAATELHKEQSA